MKSQSISTITKRFKKQWLLIRIDKLDERTLKPLKGQLVAHSPRREEVYDALSKFKGKAYVTYTGPVLPAGYAAAFIADLK